MTADQKAVGIGAASGVAAMLGMLWLLYPVMPVPSGSGQVAVRLAYAAQWNALAVLPLVAMFAAIGNARALGEAIDPTLGKESASMVINGRVAANTLEQTVLFMAGSLALAASVSDGQVRIVAAAAITFAVMRIAFWIGYRIVPLYRAFGMSSTAYLAVALGVYALWLNC